MSSKAAGPDGWEARWIAELPQPASIRLAQLYALCETKGVWPSSMTHWRIVFLPKPNQWPSPLDMRPICIGSVLYRIWTRIRLTHLRNFLTQFLVPYQSGGIGGVFRICLSLGTKNLGTTITVWLWITKKRLTPWITSFRFMSWNMLGFPCKSVTSFVINGIITNDGVALMERYTPNLWSILRAFLRVTVGLPSRCPWSCLLSNGTKLATSRVPKLFCISTTVLSLRATCRSSRTHFISGDGWKMSRACALMLAKPSPLRARGMRTNHSNSRVGTVLGVSLGMFPRSPTLNETIRADGLANIARRIGVLPVTRKFRALLASLVLTSKASWGWVLNGLSPSNVMLDRAYKVAVHHPYIHLHSSTDLWGHRSDLQFVVAPNLLVALTKWRSKHHNVPWNDNTPLIQSLRTTLSKLLCRFDNSGRVTWSLGSCDTSCSPLWCTRLAHNLRTHWRMMRLENWLQCSRNDAQVARQSGFVVTSSLVESLHQSSQHVTGHESAVLSGGLRTAAHTAEKPTHCALCHNEVCPTTDHIYWFCSHFPHLRQWPRPINDMIARVGWNTNGIQYPIFQQMARIRQALAIITKRNTNQSNLDDGGRGPLENFGRPSLVASSSQGATSNAALTKFTFAGCLFLHQTPLPNWPGSNLIRPGGFMGYIYIIIYICIFIY